MQSEGRPKEEVEGKSAGEQSEESEGHPKAGKKI